MAKQFKTSGRTRSTSRPRRTAAPQHSGGGAAIGVIGAVLAIAGIVACIVVASGGSKEEAKIEAWKKAEFEQLRASVPEQNEALVTRTKEIEAALNASRGAQQELIQKIAVAKQDLEAVEDTLEPLAPEEAELKKNLAAAEKAAEAVTGTATESVAEYRKLKAEREKIEDYYFAKLHALEDALRERMEKGPQAVKALFGQIRHTVFGPAALFQAAELYYANGERETAVNLYKQLLREYASCGNYAKAATGQIAAATGGAGYSAASIGIKPCGAISKN